MITISIFVPTASNEGKDWPGTTRRELEGKLVHLFGGFSRLPTVAGGWTGPDGVLYTDNSDEYIVAVPGLLTHYQSIVDAVGHIKREYEQEAVFVRYLGQAEIL